MTLEEFKSISNEIKLRNMTSQNMIRHCFIYNPTEEDIQNLVKMKLIYHEHKDSDFFTFGKWKRPDNEMISFLNVKIDIQCNEEGFVAYTCFFATEGGNNNNRGYLNLKENEIIGVIHNHQFGYSKYESLNFYLDMLCRDRETRPDFSIYQEIQKATALC